MVVRHCRSKQCFQPTKVKTGGNSWMHCFKTNIHAIKYSIWLIMCLSKHPSRAYSRLHFLKKATAEFSLCNPVTIFLDTVQLPKWPRPRNDPHFSSRRPRNDPQLILGMEWYSVTELLQICCSVYVLKLRLTFCYSLCDLLALLSSNRLHVNVCIFNIILNF